MVGNWKKSLADVYSYAKNQPHYSMIEDHPEEVLKNMGISIEDIRGKTITDIWAGLSPSSTYLALKGNPEKINFVDPAYTMEWWKVWIGEWFFRDLNAVNEIIEDNQYLLNCKKQLKKWLPSDFAFLCDGSIKSMEEKDSIMQFNKNLLLLWKNWIPSELQYKIAMLKKY